MIQCDNFKKCCGQDNIIQWMIRISTETECRQGIICRENSLSKGAEIWPDLGYVVKKWEETGERQIRA